MKCTSIYVRIQLVLPFDDLFKKSFGDLLYKGAKKLKIYKRGVDGKSETIVLIWR